MYAAVQINAFQSFSGTLTLPTKHSSPSQDLSDVQALASADFNDRALGGQASGATTPPENTVCSILRVLE
jgi:hypothetical protein